MLSYRKGIFKIVLLETLCDFRQSQQCIMWEIFECPTVISGNRYTRSGICRKLPLNLTLTYILVHVSMETKEGHRKCGVWGIIEFLFLHACCESFLFVVYTLPKDSIIRIICFNNFLCRQVYNVLGYITLKEKYLTLRLLKGKETDVFYSFFNFVLCKIGCNILPVHSYSWVVVHTE